MCSSDLTDEYGEPLPRAYVLVKGTKEGINIDLEEKYSIFHKPLHGRPDDQGRQHGHGASKHGSQGPIGRKDRGQQDQRRNKLGKPDDKTPHQKSRVSGKRFGNISRIRKNIV